MNTSTSKALRVWPGVVIVILQWFVRFLLPKLFPQMMVYAVLGGVLCGALILLWWLFFSRAAWVERLGALVLVAVGIYGTRPLLDPSIRTGAMGMLFYLLVVPGVSLALVVWAIVTRRQSDTARRVTMAAAILLACAVWSLARTGGFTASLQNDLHWRWLKTPEEQLLARQVSDPSMLPPAAPAAVPVVEKEAPATEPAVATKPEAAREPAVTEAAPEKETGPDWPGFRGANRDDVVTGVRIKTEWPSPPVALWKRAVGPGWSSFAVHGGVFYTQEQRGPEEIVACYRLATGEPVWAHRDATRFWESNGGPGPRGTPTLSAGRVYTFGATGIVNALNARTGAVVWTHNAAADTGAQTPQWGFASSPLVVDDQVIVATAGTLVSYDRVSGKKRWTGPAHGVSYSSPQLAKIDGVSQVLLLSEAGATSVALDSGTTLWEYAWKGYPIVQPAVTQEGDVLISVSDSSGTRRLGVSHAANGWNVEERWTSIGLKPYFNDFVVQNGYAYGFDGSILACIDLKDGKRKWKGGRYGNGQLLLLNDQNMLLVVSEEGEVVLVSATPERFEERARFPGIEGKTWNHPVMAGDLLLVRNGQEMAAFRLPSATD